MPKIQWTGLPAALRDHLFDRLRERKSQQKTFTSSKRGENRVPMRRTGSGTRTSVRSKSAAKDNTRRPSFSQAMLPKGRNSEGSLVCLLRFFNLHKPRLPHAMVRRGVVRDGLKAEVFRTSNPDLQPSDPARLA